MDSLTNRVNWLRARTIDLSCPYIYPPVSRHQALTIEDIFGSIERSDQAYALYVHVPFCAYRCHFCNFSVVTVSEASCSVDDYLDGIIVEMARVCRRIGYKPTLSSIHVGGGTPSILNTRQLTRFLSAIHDNFDLRKLTEFCMEGTPDTLSGVGGEKPRIMAEYGVNRVSLGVQAITCEALAALNRYHTQRQVRDAFDSVKKAGIKILNFDLMYCLPGVAISEFANSVKECMSIGADSISLYETKLPPRSSDYLVVADRALREVEADKSYLHASQLLRAGGFVRTMPNQFARTEGILQYHYIDVRETLTPLIAIGPSAIGHIGSTSYRTDPSLKNFIMHSGHGSHPLYTGIRLTGPELARRAVVLGLKAPRGLNRTIFRHQFGANVEDLFAAVIGELLEAGFLEIREIHICVTEAGAPVVDRLAAMFYGEEDVRCVSDSETLYGGTFWH